MIKNEEGVKKVKAAIFKCRRWGSGPALSNRVPGLTASLCCEEGVAAIFDIQNEGKILLLGLSNASADKFNKATRMGKTATVENLFSYAQQSTDPNSPYGF